MAGLGTTERGPVQLAPMRHAFGQALLDLGRSDPDVVAITADVQTSDFSYLFGDAFPERYINVGIAEMCLIDVAVGLANAGKVPFANTFAVFMASRAFEPVLTHLAYGGANVKLMAGYSGISPQMEGPTHHAITDLAVMRVLPNMTVVSPADATAMRKLLPQVRAWPGPVYYRFSRQEVPVLFDEGYQPIDRPGRHRAARPGRHPHRHRHAPEPLPVGGRCARTGWHRCAGAGDPHPQAARHRGHPGGRA